MLRVGLTGGLATGKSHVGAYLVEMGCHLLKADELGHQAMEPGGGAFDEVVRRFGRPILTASGEIDRRALGTLAFSSPEKLASLNSIIHPLVIRAEQEWYEHLGQTDPDAIGVVEAAILIETGSYKRFDKIILTVCRREQQIARAMRRDRLSRQEIEARMSRQMSLDEKRKFADYVVDTSGDRRAALIQTRRVYEQLRSLKP
ncbi:MAG TPA: dephospho-CoA kinase [Bryobacteraceae bacterium]|nr:dephospho-CoA kinase [Bryobacteraceae bacterium]